jgi:hypothetical protein
MDESLEDQGHASDESRIVIAPARAYRALKQFIALHQAETLCAVLLLLMSVNLLTAISRKSITNDEFVHIPAGYYHLVDGDFQLNNEHPPLIKMWAALPLLLIQPNENIQNKSSGQSAAERTWGNDETFWSANRERFLAISFWPRVMMVPLTLALGLLIFVFARRLFGSRAAVFAVALFSFEPTILAHGRIVHTDVPAALVYLLFFFTLHSYLQRPGLKRALLLGLAAAVALLTKFSMIVLAPVLAVCLVAGLWSRRHTGKSSTELWLHGGLVAVLMLFCINAAYRFHSPALAASDVRWVEMKSAPIFGPLISGFSLVSHVLPTYYLFGIYNVMLHNYYGHSASLLGMQSDKGWWYYFPVAFALKTTIPFLVLSATGLIWACWRLMVKREIAFLYLVAPLAIYFAISLTSNINIGIRHFLPVFPFLFIAAGALLDRLISWKKRRRAGIVVAVLVLTWSGIEAFRAYPDYIPYMNQLARGAPHWHYLSDSNVEWGDDVGALAAYLRARGETRVRAATSAGWGTLTFYGVEYIDLFKPPPGGLPETRYVAIGASFLNGSTVPGAETGYETTETRTNYFEKYRHLQPEAVFGNSIYLYRVKD